ncbi:tlde1 domain-containing protein [Methylomonas sp. LWB]|uniref:tlde1 domain-containing protein n=1 Tax=Methylomonas sp. LWB TaxID=1905845 RepID=UPI0009F37452|nr:tlde1 domain-containing protein [Methylomonas sp. LWB]
MTHIDNQSGATTPDGDGYAGHNLGLNNPDYQNVPGTGQNSNGGPLPQGAYTIEPQQNNVTGTGVQLPASMRLTPYPSNNMFGRSGFLIHGGNMSTQSSSQGCIILPKANRDIIGNSGDNVLRVVP